MNPYQSPELPSEAREPTAKKDGWWDTVKLLVYGLIFGIPIALFVGTEFFNHSVLAPFTDYVKDLIKGR